MPKNVVLCCDGTANEFAKDRTNVVKLFFTLVRDPAAQVAYYHPGLGTMEPPGTLTRATRIATRLAGEAFGYGLEADIRDAYVFLMNNFEEGDRVFLFGFSRGAYTARAVASLLRMYGLMAKGNEALVFFVRWRWRRRAHRSDIGRIAILGHPYPAHRTARRASAHP